MHAYLHIFQRIWKESNCKPAVSLKENKSKTKKVKQEGNGWKDLQASGRGQKQITLQRRVLKISHNILHDANWQA